MKIKNIILDMGNVLLDYNPDTVVNKFCSNEESKSLIIKEFFLGDEWKQMDLGYMTSNEAFEKVKTRIPPTYHNELKKCVYEWDFCMICINGAKEFCYCAKQYGYRLYVLSNASLDFYRYFPIQYDVNLFDGIVLSSEAHILKPNSDIYKLLLNKYDLKPEECIFVDDRKENVLAAEELGMTGWVFENNYGELKKFLKLHT